MLSAWQTVLNNFKIKMTYRRFRVFETEPGLNGAHVE